MSVICFGCKVMEAPQHNHVKDLRVSRGKLVGREVPSVVVVAAQTDDHGAPGPATAHKSSLKFASHAQRSVSERVLGPLVQGGRRCKDALALLLVRPWWSSP